MGLGLLGRGVGDARFLAQCGAELIVTDKKTETELAQSLEKLKDYSNSTYVLGGHRLEDFRNRDMILKAAGVPLGSPYIAEAHAHNIPVRMSADLLVECAGVKTVGVTGTRGKSTVTHMIAHVLRETGKHAVLGGNIRDVSNLALLPEVRRDSILVLELDSWQLQGFGEAKMSPNIAVFTTFMPDHQDYYPDMEMYFNDKAHIFRFQKEGDVLVAGKDVASGWIKDSAPVAPIVPEEIPEDWKLRIPGKHNRENAACAAGALRALGLGGGEIKAGIESFAGVEGRLQFVREAGGIKIYNDNNSTTPDATLVALRALDEGGRNIILVMGGADKGLDMSELVSEIPKYCKGVALLAGTGTEKIKTHIPSDIMIYHNISQNIFSSLKEAVEAGLAAGEPGDTLLFSPAFASFGLFKNEYDRNDRFLKIVDDL